jgi:hypothetical protein
METVAIPQELPPTFDFPVVAYVLVKVSPETDPDAEATYEFVRVGE